MMQELQNIVGALQSIQRTALTLVEQSNRVAVECENLRSLLGRLEMMERQVERLEEQGPGI